MSTLKTTKKGETPKETIQRYIQFKMAEGRTEGTIHAYTTVIGDVAMFFDKPFTELTQSDLERYLVDYAGRPGKHGNGKTSASRLVFVRTVLKQFFKWLYGNETYPTCVKWIEIQSVEREIDERDVLEPEDVYKLLRAAESGSDQALVARNKALLHVLYESGGRINEVRTRKVKDVLFAWVGDGDPVLTAQLFIPPRRAGKGKEKGKYLLLIDSAPALEAWLQKHPNPEPNEPLWVNLHAYHGKAMGYSTVHRMLKRLAKQCGLKKPVNPHNFRHSQVTESATYLSDQELKQKFGWTRDSRMLQIYSHITDQKVSEKELEARGIRRVKHKKKRILTHVRCEQCGRVYSAGRRICECGRPLDPDLAQRYDQRKHELEIATAEALELFRDLGPEGLRALTEAARQLIAKKRT